MYNILTEFELTSPIKIKDLGIVFRKLSNDEKNDILKQIDDIYFKNKRLITEYAKKYKKDEDMNLMIDLQKYDETTRKIVTFCFIGLKSGFKLNTKEKMKQVLNHTIIIESDENILSKFVDKKNQSKFISNLLSLYDIYSKDIQINNKVRWDYSYILSDNILNKNETDHDINLIVNNVFSYKKNNSMKKLIELSEDYLQKLSIFFSQLEVNEIRRFINTVDLLFSQHTMPQNEIINNITIIESILLNENEDIKSNYVLKSGLILKYYVNTDKKIINKFIKDLLNYSYDVRSAVVHGNEEKILSTYNSILQKNSNIKDMIKMDLKEYNDKKFQALSLANSISFLATRAVIKFWIDNPSVISFIKT